MEAVGNGFFALVTKLYNRLSSDDIERPPNLPQHETLQQAAAILSVGLIDYLRSRALTIAMLSPKVEEHRIGVNIFGLFD